LILANYVNRPVAFFMSFLVVAIIRSKPFSFGPFVDRSVSVLQFAASKYLIAIMKLGSMVLVAALACPLASSFVLTPSSSSSTRALVSAKATVDVEAPPAREAPGAGSMPDWENRPGKENFLDSDLSQPDLSEMWECPLTRWDSEGYGLPD
jgi:hypothetical protein